MSKLLREATTIAIAITRLSHLDRNFRHQSYQAHVQPPEPTRTDETARKPPCPKSDGHHAPNRCFKFRDLSPEGKKQFLIETRRCFLCFAANHGRSSCRAEYRCRTCGGKHNTALHDALARPANVLVAHTPPDGATPSHSVTSKNHA